MENTLTEPKYIYADILIALAEADGHVAPIEREFLDAVFEKMSIDPEIGKQMWHTPRTLDVIEEVLKDIADEPFKNCLLKDCWLLAYTDDDLDASETRFIKHIGKVMDVGDVSEEIHQWVMTAVEQKQAAIRLFGDDS